MKSKRTYRAVPIVVMEDTPIHIAQNKYRCHDFTCPCWADLHEQEAAFERTFIEVGMTERYDALPWRYGNSLR